MIIDDHSSSWSAENCSNNDNACNFQKVLKSAIAAYGIPDKLYVDNGCSYSNEQLSMICVSLGILPPSQQRSVMALARARWNAISVP